jgi:hypothetical protein
MGFGVEHHPKMTKIQPENPAILAKRNLEGMQSGPGLE